MGAMSFVNVTGFVSLAVAANAAPMETAPTNAHTPAVRPKLEGIITCSFRTTPARRFYIGKASAVNSPNYKHLSAIRAVSGSPAVETGSLLENGLLQQIPGNGTWRVYH